MGFCIQNAVQNATLVTTVQQLLNSSVVTRVTVCVCLAGSELHKFGALKLLLSLLTETAELTASQCVLTLANMSSYGMLSSDVIQLNAVHGLVTLLGKAQ